MNEEAAGRQADEGHAMSIHPLLERAGRLFDSVADVVDALARRGETVERRQRARAERRLDQAGRNLARARDQIADRAEVLAQSLWRAFDVPTRSDLLELSKSVDQLTRRVEQLTKDSE